MLGERIGLPAEVWPVGLLLDPEWGGYRACASMGRLASLFGSLSSQTL